MLSSIHPLGERGKGNRFAVTAAAFVVGATLGGATLGATASAIGVALAAVVPDSLAITVVAVVAVAGAWFEWTGRSLPSVPRQVDEDWLNEYRGWVYGIGFGFQLGAGVLTYITSAAVYVMIAAAVLVASPVGAVAIGTTFGLVRGLTLLPAGTIQTTQSLVEFHRRLDRSAHRVRLAVHIRPHRHRTRRRCRPRSGAVMKVIAPGITMDLPPGWEAEVDGGAGTAEDDMETVRTPRAHIANFDLPPVRGDFGSGAVERMIDGDVLICLLEESSGAVDSSLHGQREIPTILASDFSPDAMQRPLKGQSGTQVFFHVGGRAFVLYVVLGGHASRQARIDVVNEVLQGITFTDD